MTFPQDPGQQPGNQHPGQYEAPRPASGPQYPPQPGYAQPVAPPKKGMGTGKLLLLIFGILAVVCCGGGAIVYGLGAGKTSSTGTNTGGGSAAKTHAKMNQAARDGKFEFTVTKVQCGLAKVGDDLLNKAPQGQYCLVTVTVKNIGNEARTFDGSNQHAFGAGGVKYDNDGTAEIYANSQTQTFLEQINPGNGVTGVLVFDIPKDAKIIGLELHDSAFSGGVLVDIA